MGIPRAHRSFSAKESDIKSYIALGMLLVAWVLGEPDHSYTGTMCWITVIAVAFMFAARGVRFGHLQGRLIGGFVILQISHLIVLLMMNGLRALSLWNPLTLFRVYSV